MEGETMTGEDQADTLPKPLLESIQRLGVHSLASNSKGTPVAHDQIAAYMNNELRWKCRDRHSDQQKSGVLR
jgi:hypothetical protein